MDSSQLDVGDGSSPETLSDSSLSAESPETNGIFGDPMAHPRVGDEYQVETPSLLSDSERVQYKMNPADSEHIVDSSYSFLMGLPVQLMWACNQANPIKSERVESLNDPHATYMNDMGSGKIATTHNSMAMQNPDAKISGPTQTYMSNGSCLVPGQPTVSWNEFEADCFLLGLYLFGKNLLQVKWFVESKSQGQILSYYYCKFYGSPGYNRWSMCRKMKSRKCVVGQSFFTIYRLQELFSRLCPHLSEESQTKLLEAGRGFTEGSTSLDDYIFTLKALVGIPALVNAVGIGKGKGDLTTFILDGSRNNQVHAHRPEVPSGKACSSLSCAEIVKYLTGDFRLSKARSNDLFWEAVWPRLLARGWHSEQPMGDGYTGSKHCLVFLVPGIIKFSRRKLLKGEEYFDSVSDVLAKVASEPELLEFEEDEINPSNSKEVNGWTTEGKSNEDEDSSDHERHCYLKPHVPLGLSDRIQFTVIDTSLANEDNSFMVRELRNFPVEVYAFQNSRFSAHSRGLPSANGESQRISGGAYVSLDQQSRTAKHQFRHQVKPVLTSCASLVKQRWRVTLNIDTDVTFVLSLPAKNQNPSLKIVAPSKERPTNVKMSDKSLAAGIISEKRDKGSINGNHVDIDTILDHENLSEPHTTIDLNLAPIPEPQSDVKVILNGEVGYSNQYSDDSKPENFDADKQKHCDFLGHSHIVAEIPKTSEAKNSKQFGSEILTSSEDTLGPSDIMEPETISVVGKSPQKEREFDQNPRRQSTRNRPLTTKALEALEFGFLDPVRTYKKRSPSMSLDQKPKRSCQMHSKSFVSPQDTVLKISAPEQYCKGRTGMMDYFAGPIQNEKEAGEKLELSQVSLPSASS